MHSGARAGATDAGSVVARFSMPRSLPGSASRFGGASMRTARSTAGAIILAFATTVPVLTSGCCLVNLGGGVSLAALLTLLAEFVLGGQWGMVAGLLGNPLPHRSGDRCLAGE